MSISVTEASAPAADVERLMIEKIGPALEGVPYATGIAALLSFTILSLYPDATEKELGEGVRGMSGWLVSWIDSCVDPGQVPN